MSIPFVEDAERRSLILLLHTAEVKHRGTKIYHMNFIGKGAKFFSKVTF